jgi:cytoskeletal protein CcmA (bactofilin family)
MSQSSVIGAGTVVHGSVGGEGSLQILGRVEGDVEMSGEVSVGDGGAVRGNVSATKISVHGAVQGDLRGTEAILLERGARVVGDLSAPRIGIGNGALVRGSVRTEGEPALSPNKRAPAAAFKPLAFVAKPVAKVEPKPAPVPPPPAAATDDDDDDDAEDDDAEDEVAMAALPPARPKEQEPARRPPPPVLPSLGKAAKAKKKKGRDE